MFQDTLQYESFSCQTPFSHITKDGLTCGQEQQQVDELMEDAGQGAVLGAGPHPQLPGPLKAMPCSTAGGTGTPSEWGDMERMASRNGLSSLERDPMTTHHSE